jgi:hypothetical protein
VRIYFAEYQSAAIGSVEATSMFVYNQLLPPGPLLFVHLASTIESLGKAVEIALANNACLPQK